MLARLARMARQPRRYARIAIRRAEKSLTWVFRGTAFFLQGQMDINPASLWHNPEFAERTGGYYPPSGPGDRRVLALEPWDTVRRDMLILLLRAIVSDDVPGDFAEIGVYRGSTARLIHHYAPERSLHLFDTFEGFGTRGAREELAASGHHVDPSGYADTDVARVRAFIAPRNDNVSFHPGFFPESVPPGFSEKRFAFVHLDADLYDPIRAGLEFFYERMAPGGFLVVHDYNAWPGARRAVDEFCATRSIRPLPMPDKSGSAVIATAPRRS